MDIIKNVIGTDIHIDDSNGDEIVDLELLGQTSQNGTPTPESPVPINVVSGRQVVRVCGKNLAKIFEGTSTYTSGTTTYTTTGTTNKLIVSNNLQSGDANTGYNINIATGTTQRWAYIPANILSQPSQSLATESGTYTISLKVDGGTYSGVATGSVRATVGIVDTSTNTARVEEIVVGGLTGNINVDRNLTFTIGTNEYIKCIGFYTQNIIFNNQEIKIQLKKGSSSSSYEEYKGNDYEINLGANLLNIQNTWNSSKDEITNGLHYVLNSDDSISISGTSTGYSGKYSRAYNTTSVFLTLKANHTYRLLAEISDKTSNLQSRVYFGITNSNMNNAFAITSMLSNGVYYKDYTPTSDVNLTQYSIIGSSSAGETSLTMKVAIYDITNSVISTYIKYKTPIYLNCFEDNSYRDKIRRNTGKNVINIREVVEENLVTETSGWSIIDDYTFQWSGTTGSTVGWFNDAYLDLPSGTYTVSGKYNNSSNLSNMGDIRIRIMNADNTTKITDYTVTYDKEAGEKFRLLFYKNRNNSSGTSISITETFSNVMIEKGDTATEFEPFGKNQWYIHKEIGRVVLNGSESYWGYDATNSVFLNNSPTLFANRYLNQNGYSNYFKNVVNANITNNYTAGQNLQNGEYSFRLGTKDRLYLKNTAYTNANDFKTWLNTHNTEVYYVLNTPQVEIITDQELISQLNALKGATLPEGEVNINVNGDLPAILDLDYFTTDRYISPEDRESLLDGSATIPFKINVIKDGEIIKTLTERSIVNIDYEDYRYVNTSSLVIGQFVARKVNGTLDQIYTEFEIEDTELEIQMGISYGGTTNYYSLGNFLVTKPTNDDVKDKTTFEALDYAKKFNKLFDPSGLEFPCTALDLARYTCELCGVELGTTGFANADFVIENNQYVEKETCRKVMQDIGKLAYSWIRIDWDNKCYIDFNVGDTVATENVITNTEYYDLSLQKEVFGPVNRVVIGMENIDGENVVIEDSESIEENGVTEIQLYDNYLTYTPELREVAIQQATRLFGLTYMPLETNTIGHPWLIGKEKIEVKDMDNNSIYTYPWDRTISYKGHIKSKITSKADTKTETEYRNYGDVETALTKTRIVVDKQNQNISALTSRTTKLEENTYTIDQVNELVQNAESGITNTFSTSGGNNIFRNTGLWFENSGEDSQQNPYEFWTGTVSRIKEENAVNMNAMVLQSGDLIQEQIVPNGSYVVSFRYKKLVSLSNVKVYINNDEYSLNSTEDTEFIEVIQVNNQHINIKFTSNTINSCEIYDLMVNTGNVKLAYTQNQNETTTDTVNISKGITITSSDLEVTFKANADGIRTLDRNNNVITKFTDTGMTTKRAEIQEKSEIVGTLWQEVESQNSNKQTWITRL